MAQWYPRGLANLLLFFLGFFFFLCFFGCTNVSKHASLNSEAQTSGPATSRSSDTKAPLPGEPKLKARPCALGRPAHGGFNSRPWGRYSWWAAVARGWSKCEVISACESIKQVAETPGKRRSSTGTPSGRRRSEAAGRKCERTFFFFAAFGSSRGTTTGFVCLVLAIASSVGLIFLALGWLH